MTEDKVEWIPTGSALDPPHLLFQLADVHPRERLSDFRCNDLRLWQLALQIMDEHHTVV